MDIKIKIFQEATETFAYLAQLDLAELKQKLGDERLVDGIQNGRAQKFEYTTELCWKAIKFFLKEKEGVDEASPKKLSKHITLGVMPRKTTTCCCLRRWRTEIVSAIFTMQKHLTTSLHAFPDTLHFLSGSARN
jgi:hypothetical protein